MVHHCTFIFKEILMKKFMKLVIFSLFAFVSLSASAVCYSNSNYVPPGSPPLILANGLWCTAGENQNQNLQNVAYVQQQQVLQQGLPMVGNGMSGLTNCQMVGGLAGATLGSLAENHTAQAMILGGLIGGVAGNMICNNQNGQQVLVRQGQNGVVSNGVVTNNGNVVTIPSSCKVGGRDFGEMPEASCLKIRDALTTTTASETKQVVTDAYCVMRRQKGSDVEEKRVSNPSKSQSFCDQTTTALRSGQKRWEDL
jgi:hypothetical protein